MMLTGEQLIVVREAVADMQQQSGMPEMAARILQGECDSLPMMRAAIAAVERVLRGMAK